MKERRSERRQLCSDLARISWTDTAGTEHVETAIIDDLSAQGACVQIECDVAPGTRVRLSFPARDYEAVVRHCAHQPPLGYIAGLQFPQGSDWPDNCYEMRHRFDPKWLERPDGVPPAPRLPCHALRSCPKPRVARHGQQSGDGRRQVTEAAHDAAAECGNLDQEDLPRCFHKVFGSGADPAWKQLFVRKYNDCAPACPGMTLPAGKSKAGG